MPGRSVVDSPARKQRHTPRKKDSTPQEQEVALGTPTRASTRTRAKLLSSSGEEVGVSPGRRSARNQSTNSSSVSSRSRDCTPRKGKKGKGGDEGEEGKENSTLQGNKVITPSKRKNNDSHPLVSPAKLIKSEATNIVISSPSVQLSKLSINSPRGGSRQSRTPLKSSNKQAQESPRAKRGSLFSPSKLSADAINDMLFETSSGDDKNENNNNSVTGKVKNKNEINDDGVFKKPDASVRTPVKKAQTPQKNGLSNGHHESPLKGLTHDKLEDLICSPVKISSPRSLNKVASPVRKPDPSPKRKVASKKASPLKICSAGDLENLLCSPIKSPSPVKLAPAPKVEEAKPEYTRSPRKPLMPMKSPRKAAANLFTSPVKSAPGLLRSPLKSAVPTSTTLIGNNNIDISQLQLAKGALHTGTPDQLLCRGDQVNTMSLWLDQHLMKNKPGSLYVSGAPGTGKTATLTHLLNTKTKSYQSIFINCMVLKSSAAIFKEVAKQMNPKTTASNEKDALKEIEKCTTSKGKMILLVLDEVDQLDSKNQDVLYTIFEWPALPNSRLSLIGIANTLDLTDRVLPRLKIKECYRPTLIHYPPYTKQQIIEIITKRLAQQGVDKDVVTTRAITYLAGKISTLSGDIRKALDVCRRALEQAETSAKKQSILKPMMAPRGLGSPLTSPQKGYKCPRPAPAKAGQVDLPQIMKVINQVYGSKISSSMSTSGSGIPTQQKILMASLLLLVKKGSSKEVTLGKLVQTYTKVCKKRGMVASDELECVGMVQGLESRGMLKYHCKSEAPRYAKITLRLDENEVGMALQDKTLLSSIVEDVSCLE